MAKRITTKELKDGLKLAKEEARDLVKIYDLFLKDLQKTASILKANKGKISLIDAKQLSKVNQLLAQTNALQKERVSTDSERKKQLNEVEKLEIKLSSLRKGELDQTIKLRKEISNITRAKKDKLSLEKQEETALVKLNRARRNAQVQLKEMAIRYGETNKRTLIAKKRFDNLDSALRKVNKLAKDGRIDVGRYGLAWGKTSRSLLSVSKNLIGAFGLIGGVQLLAQGLRETFNIVKNFSSAQSELAGILGKNKDEIKDLTAVTLKLGSTTSFTATQVTKAATELAKLGFTTDEIKVSLQGVLDGAIALGAEIPETAKLIAGTLKAFNLEASESERVVSTLSVATTKGGLDFSKLETAMGNVAPAAAAFGASIEETTALLSLIVDKNIDASTAGTQLRNMFIELKSQGLTLDEALTKIATSQDKLTTANELFGKKGAVTAIALADQKDLITETTLAITDQREALERLVATRLDNIEGDIDKLTSAWEGFVLSVENGEGVFGEVLRFLIQQTTKLINLYQTLGDSFGAFFQVLKKEFKPFTDLIVRLINYFGEFNSEISWTKILIGRVVIGIKVLILPFRLAAQAVLLLKDSFSVLSNEVKKYLNLVGGSFDVDENLSFDNIAERIKKIGEVFKDTFTINNPELAEEEIKKGLEKLNKLKKEYRAKNKKEVKEEEKKEEQTEEQKQIDATNKRLDRYQEEFDKKLELEEIQAEKEKALADDTAEYLTMLNDRIFERKQKQLQQELDNNLRSQDEITNAINNGSVLAEKSLAEAKKEQIEIEQEQIKFEKQRLLIEGTIAGLNAYAQNGDVVGTISAISIINNAIKGLDGFYEGTDEVGSTNSETKYSNIRDGYIAKLDKGEKVFNARQSSELNSLGFNTREDVLEMARSSTKRATINANGTIVSVDNTRLISEVKEMNTLLKKLPNQMPIHNTGITDDPRYIQEIIKTENLKETTKRRANGTWA